MRRVLDSSLIFFAVAALATVSTPPVAVAQETASGDGPVAVFRDFVETTEVQLMVSVLGTDGEPLKGLDEGAFRVLEDGDPVEVTDVVEVDRSDLDAFGGSAAGPIDRRLVLLFDRPSLEKRAARRVAEAIHDYLDGGLDSHTKTMVVLTGEQLQVVQPFTDDPTEVRLALETLRDAELGGDAISATKIAMRRSIRGADPMQSGWSRSESLGESSTTASGSFLGQGGAEDNLGTMMAGQYLDQINGFRQAEASRVLIGLSGIEAALRGVAGLPGRKDVVWIGQDLLVHPGVDVYTEFFEKFQRFSGSVEIDQPEIWARDLELSRQFDAVAQLAQAAGAIVHVLDTADRDRMRGPRENAGSFQDVYAMGDPRNFVLSAGPELAGAAGVSDGALQLAVATGGTWHGGNRDAAAFFERFENLTERYYQVSYRPSGAMDGSYHDVRVEVRGAEAVAARSRVANLSPDHHLADRAVAELSLGIGDDEMGFELSLADRQVRDDGTIVQAFRLVLPADALVMLPTEDGRVVATLGAAVAVLGGDGQIQPPRVFPLSIPLPAAQAVGTTKVATSFRLALDPGTRTVAVAVLDRHSGLGGSHRVDIEG